MSRRERRSRTRKDNGTARLVVHVTAARREPLHAYRMETRTRRLFCEVALSDRRAGAASVFRCRGDGKKEIFQSRSEGTIEIYTRRGRGEDAAAFCGLGGWKADHRWIFMTTITELGLPGELMGPRRGSRGARDAQGRPINMRYTAKGRPRGHGPANLLKVGGATPQSPSNGGRWMQHDKTPFGYDRRARSLTHAVRLNQPTGRRHRRGGWISVCVERFLAPQIARGRCRGTPAQTGQALGRASLAALVAARRPAAHVLVRRGDRGRRLASFPPRCAK